jgi:head-tail adaptor
MIGNILQKQRIPTLQAGKLRHAISIVRPSNAQDDTGGISSTDVTLFENVYASIEPLHGNEQMAAGSFVAVATHQIVIRYIDAAPNWLLGQQYLTGALILDPNGNLQKCTTPGTSGATIPTVWGAIPNATTADNGIVWTYVGVAPLQSGVDSGMKVIFNGRTFNIVAVLNPLEVNKALVLTCLEVNQSKQQQPVNVSTGIGPGA